MHPFFRFILYTFWISISFYAVYYQNSENKKFEYEGIVTHAQITDLQREVDDDGSTSYYPILEFKDVAGRKVEFKSIIPDSEHLVGDSLEVIYLKDNPRQARVVSFSSAYTGIIIGSIFGFLGLLFVALDIYFSIVRKRNEKKSSYIRVQRIKNETKNHRPKNTNKKAGSDEIEDKPASSDPE